MNRGDNGQAKVTIDGTTVAAGQDLYAAGYAYDTPFTYSGLSGTGYHTLIIRCLGTKATVSSDTYITLQGLTVQ